MPSLIKRFNANITSVPEVFKSGYFPAINGLRAISILLVITNHFCTGSPYEAYFSGVAGVNIFFVISGFLITTLLIKEKINSGKISLKKFYIRRILRIVPVYYLFIVILFFLNIIFKLKIKALSFVLAILYAKNIPLTSLWDWYTAHFWSLAVEEQFYILWPILLVYDVNKYAKTILLTIVLVSIIQVLGYYQIGVFGSNKIAHTLAFIVINLFGNFIPIAIGSLLSILIYKRIINFEKLNPNYFLSFGLFVLALFIHNGKSPIDINHCDIIIFPTLMGMILILSLKPKSFFNLILTNPVMVRIGVLSYSIYIWQQLFTNKQPWANSFKYGDTVWFNLLGIASVATLSYYLFEKKFLTLKEKYK